MDAQTGHTAMASERDVVTIKSVRDRAFAEIIVLLLGRRSLTLRRALGRSRALLIASSSTATNK